MRLLARLGAALLAFASPAQAGDGVTAFMGATLIDGTGREPVARFAFPFLVSSVAWSENTETDARPR